MIRYQLHTAVVLLAILTFCFYGCEEEEAPANYVKPVIMEVTPTEGLRGTTVNISGEDLTDVAGVKFGSIEVSDFDKSAGTISMKVPEDLEEGETTITVYYPGAVSSNLGPSATIPFKVLYQPVLTDVFPAQSKPTYEVTLSGNYLKSAFSLMFDSIITPFEASQTGITATVPDMPAGSIVISVSTPGGVASLPFEVLAKTPEIYSFDPAAGGRTGEQVSILGKFFVDVQSVQIGEVEVIEYNVENESEIVVTIPEGAAAGKVTVRTAIGEVISEADLNVIEIPYVFFAEGLHAGIENWGWGGTDDFASTQVAREGDLSYERTYTEGWSGIQLHHGSLNLTPYSAIEFSVYGGPGTTGKVLNLNVNWGASSAVTLTEGEWTDYTVSLADLGNPEILNELIFQENGETNPQVPFTVYLDNIKFIE